MGPFKSFSFSQVFLAMIIILILASNAKAEQDAGSFCSTTNAGEEKALCKSLVKGAKSWDEALSNVINVIIVEAKKAKPLIDGLPDRLPSSLLKVTKDSIEKTCKESYESIFDELNGALENIKTGDKMNSIDTQLSAALSSFSDCTDGLAEFGVDEPEFSEFHDLVQKYASISLAVSSTKPN